MQRLVLAILGIGCAVSTGACGSDSESAPPGPPAASIFVVPASLDELAGPTFFDHPFPSDVRTDADGTARYAGWPNPFEVKLLSEYVVATKGLFKGFSPAGTIYLRFTAPIDTSSLPADPPASLAKDSSVQIVDVDSKSPEYGQRRLAQVRFQKPEAIYVPSATLAVLPMIGTPLRPSTTYAVVVTKKIRAEGGGAIEPSRDLAEVLGVVPTSARTQPVRDVYGPAISELGGLGIPKEDIAHLAVFTTNDPTAETFALLDDVKTQAAPAAKDFVATESTADYDVYEGTYGPTPLYQQGTAPFAKPADGGSFLLENGKPKLVSTIDLRFALVVPNATKCPPPANGYPVVLYAHGTGGDYRSFVGDGTAASLAQRCLASTGIDQVLHGTRPGAPPESDPNHDSKIELYFFNFENPLAARTHNRQAAADVVQQARLFTTGGAKVPAAVSKSGADIAFDGTKITFFGHSQGGLNGPLFLAGSDLARGGVLSGAGSIFGIALLEKTKPVDIPAAVRFLAKLGGEDERVELDIFHPIITLAQTMVDATDTIHYGRSIITEPRAGCAPKSIYQAAGWAADGSGDT
jgi:predicted esterase